MASPSLVCPVTCVLDLKDRPTVGWPLCSVIEHCLDSHESGQVCLGDRFSCKWNPYRRPRRLVLTKRIWSVVYKMLTHYQPYIWHSCCSSTHWYQDLELGFTFWDFDAYYLIVTWVKQDRFIKVSTTSRFSF